SPRWACCFSTSLALASSQSEFLAETAAHSASTNLRFAGATCGWPQPEMATATTAASNVITAGRQDGVRRLRSGALIVQIPLGPRGHRRPQGRIDGVDNKSHAAIAQKRGGASWMIAVNFVVVAKGIVRRMNQRRYLAATGTRVKIDLRRGRIAPRES